MKRFQFTLQSVLDLREREEETALEAFLLARRGHECAMAHLRDAEREIGIACSLHGTLHRQGCRAADLNQLHDYFCVLERRRTDLASALALAEQQMRLSEERLRQARQRREVLEKCRAFQRRRHEDHLRRAEQKECDELAQHCSPVLAYATHDEKTR